MIVPSKSHQERKRKEGGVEGKEGKLNRNYLRLIPGLSSRGENELIGMLKIAAGDVISIGEAVGYEVHVHSIRN